MVSQKKKKPIIFHFWNGSPEVKEQSELMKYATQDPAAKPEMIQVTENIAGLFILARNITANNRNPLLLPSWHSVTSESVHPRLCLLTQRESPISARQRNQSWHFQKRKRNYGASAKRTLRRLQPLLLLLLASFVLSHTFFVRCNYRPRSCTEDGRLRYLTDRRNFFIYLFICHLCHLQVVCQI